MTQTEYTQAKAMLKVAKQLADEYGRDESIGYIVLSLEADVRCGEAACTRTIEITEPPKGTTDRSQLIAMAASMAKEEINPQMKFILQSLIYIIQSL